MNTKMASTVKPEKHGGDEKGHDTKAVDEFHNMAVNFVLSAAEIRCTMMGFMLLSENRKKNQWTIAKTL